MSILKKLLFALIFIVAALIAPAVILLLFVDSSTNFAVYVVVYCVIIFGVLGYILASIKSMETNFKDAMEEIKKQNAAIAYKITQAPVEVNVESVPSETPTDKNDYIKEDTSKIPLNPAEPLVIKNEEKEEQPKPKVKIVDDNFDDFK